MCGICGIVSRNHITDSERESVLRMREAMLHRGPDGAGMFEARHVCMGMRRLSIIGLQDGFQPMYSEDRRVALVANGEIYNYIELREELKRRGHLFSGGSDCEVIVHLYEECGSDCVKHLRGMFVFALWDDHEQHLLLARDRMGEKPLYLMETSDRLVFASEMKAMLKSGQVSSDIDPVAVGQFFHYSYIPEPRTPLRSVRKHPAATTSLIQANPWRTQRSTYWRMDDSSVENEDFLIDSLDRTLSEASHIALRSDVPVGISLSGGLDSSLIAAYAAREAQGQVSAITVGYEGCPASDERRDAAEFARAMKMPFHEVELSTNDVVGAFGELNLMRDDPIADPAGQAYYAVMQHAHELGIKVMLQGQGGDELFLGYDWLPRAIALTRLRRDVRTRRWGKAAKGYAALFKPTGPTGSSFWHARQWLKKGCGLPSAVSLCLDHLRQPTDQLSMTDGSDGFRQLRTLRSDLFTRDFCDSVTDRLLCEPMIGASGWDRADIEIMKVMCETYLRCNGIAQGDRLSMAASVEMRLPLVDFKVVELAMAARRVQAETDFAPKKFLKALATRVIPKRFVDRPKRGFTPPVREWERGILARHGDQLRRGMLVRLGVLTPTGADALVGGELPTCGPISLTFKALVLEEWLKQIKVPILRVAD